MLWRLLTRPSEHVVTGPPAWFREGASPRSEMLGARGPPGASLHHSRLSRSACASSVSGC